MLIILIFVIVYIFLIMPSIKSPHHLADEYTRVNAYNPLTKSMMDEQSTKGLVVDVRMSKDEVLYVYPETNMKRLSDHPYDIQNVMSYTIESLSIQDVTPIYRLSDLLVQTTRPLILNLCTTHDRDIVASSCERLLEGSTQSIAIISSDITLLKWFRTHAPLRLRGNSVDNLGFKLGWHHALTRPHFLILNGNRVGYNPMYWLFCFLGGLLVGTKEPQSRFIKTYIKEEA